MFGHSVQPSDPCTFSNGNTPNLQIRQPQNSVSARLRDAAYASENLSLATPLLQPGCSKQTQRLYNVGVTGFGCFAAPGFGFTQPAIPRSSAPRLNIALACPARSPISAMAVCAASGSQLIADNMATSRRAASQHHNPQKSAGLLCPAGYSKLGSRFSRSAATPSAASGPMNPRISNAMLASKAGAA